ncbi:MAG: purine-binding chemotaxis protein CheW [Synergistaceae bacterium]|nr:chemotaxis protein CheW [Synergistota bacterium]NLM71511.1 purine-binding chemotaxis protein CheW [Synergistaceae bacterium]
MSTALESTELKELKQTETGGEGRESITLVFTLYDEDYGLDVNLVREIVRVPPFITRVPNSPDYVLGVINLRGSIVPVFDMELKIGMKQKELTDEARIVVLSWNESLFGIIVDSVREVCTIFESNIDSADKLSTGMDKKYILGVARQEDGRLIVLLDLAALFDYDQFMGEE